jgi:hypothetical protein
MGDLLELALGLVPLEQAAAATTRAEAARPVRTIRELRMMLFLSISNTVISERVRVGQA